MADADRSRTAPGQALHDLLALYTPAVILIDEFRSTWSRRRVPGDCRRGRHAGLSFGFCRSRYCLAVPEPAGVLGSLSAASEVPQGEHGVRFAAAKVRLKVDHRRCVVVAAKSPNRTADEVA